MLRIDVERAIVRSRMDPTSQAVMMAATRLCMRKDGTLRELYASWETLCREAVVTRRTLSRRLTKLRDAGWLVDTGQRAGVTGRIVRYRFAIPARWKQCQPGTTNSATVALRRTEKEEQREKVSGKPDESTDHTGETMSTDEQPTLFRAGQAQGLPGEEQTSDTQPTQPEKPDEWLDVMRTWTELAKERGKRGTPYQRRSPTGKSMAARITEHGKAAVLQVFRWYWRSNHERAQFLRNGEYALTTLVRPDNFVSYLNMSESDATACAITHTAMAQSTLGRKPGPTMVRKPRGGGK